MSDETERKRRVGGETTTDLLERWNQIREHELVIVGLTALGVFFFPWLFVEGRAPIISTALHGFQDLASLILIWGIFVIGYDLLHGYTGLLSFGHAAFWGVAAYVAGIISSSMMTELVGAPMGYPLLMIVGGTVAAILLAWVLGYLSLRRGGIYFAILTLAFGQMIYYLMLQPLSPITSGENGFTDVSIQPLLGMIHLESEVPVVGMFVGRWMYVLVGMLTIIAVAVAYRILNSPYGTVFRAIRENETRAEFVGLNVWRYKLMSFILSGAFGGVAGSLFAIHGGYVPIGSLYWTTSGEVVIMSIIGGVGSLFGALFGAGVYLYVKFVVGGIREIILFHQIDQVLAGPQAIVLPFDIGSYWHLILGLVFVAIVVFFPHGIWGAITDARQFVAGLVRGER